MAMHPEEHLIEQLEKHELLDCLEEVVQQACGILDDGDVPERLLDSLGLRAYADALHLLARLGRVQIYRESGRCVMAKWVKRS